jgi:ubiquitin-protein ligase
MIRRIQYEIEMIKKERPDYFLIYNIPYNYNNSITFHLIKEFFDVIIIFEKSYPFTPPKLLFNYEPLPHIYNKGSECLNCTSLLCSNNWLPVVKVYDLLKDLDILINAYYREKASKSLKEVKELKYFNNLPYDIIEKIISFV